MLSERSTFAAAVLCTAMHLGGCDSYRPSGAADRAVSVATFASLCEQTVDACEWYGIRQEETGRTDGAAIAYTKACDQRPREGHACVRLFNLAMHRSLTGAARDAALALACARGVLAACELEAFNMEVHSAPEERRMALTYWRRACPEDKASCANLGLAYFTGQVDGVQVLEGRDAPAAAYYLQRAVLHGTCGSVGNQDYFVHARPEGTPTLFRDQVCRLRRLATATLGDMYLVGDGVPQSFDDAAESYSWSSETKLQELRKDPRAARAVATALEMRGDERHEEHERQAAREESAERERKETRAREALHDARELERDREERERRAHTGLFGTPVEDLPMGDTDKAPASSASAAGTPPASSASSATTGRARSSSSSGNDCGARRTACLANVHQCIQPCDATFKMCDAACSRQLDADVAAGGAALRGATGKHDACYASCIQTVRACQRSCGDCHEVTCGKTTID